MQTPNQNVTALENYAGSYSKQLIGQTLNGLDIVSSCKVIYNLTAPLNLSKLIVNGGIRPLDTAVNMPYAPGRVWSLRTITPRVGMKIFSVVPAELLGTWMSEMLDPNAIDVPFAEWVWTQEFNKLAEEINDNIAYSEYHGDAPDFDPTIAYAVGSYVVYGATRDIYKVTTLTTAGQTPVSNPSKFTVVTNVSLCDGPLTIIQNELNADNLTAVATGAITDDNAVAKLQSVWESAPVVIRTKATKMFVGYDVWESYKANYNSIYGANFWNQQNIENATQIFLQGSSGKCEIVPCTWMGSSQRVFMTLPDNFLMGTNALADFAGLGKMIPNLHGFSAICKFILSFQFADLEVLYVNDQV